MQVQSAEVTFGQVEVTLGPEPDQATAQVVAMARIDKVEELWVQDLRLTLTKTTGDWRITLVETAASRLRM